LAAVVSAKAGLIAGVAQLVEQLIRNQQVIGSSPIAGSRFPKQNDDLATRGSA
jgi:hypothetical protein